MAAFELEVFKYSYYNEYCNIDSYVKLMLKFTVQAKSQEKENKLYKQRTMFA